MLEQLKSLIFGLEEYNKTKLEIRFELVKNLLDKLEIKNLEDFEIIEDISYKVKDLLRVKSSNLNKVINNPAKSLKKKEVLDILLKLDLIKQSFLNSAFSLMNYKSTNLQENYEKKEQQVKENIFEEKNDIKSETKKLLDEDSYNNSNLSQLVIIENDDYKVTLENGKVAYIMIYFKKIVDYSIIKNFLILFFEVYLPHGTNVIVENNRVLIIPRMVNDELFILPHLENVDLNEIFSKLYSNINLQKNLDEKKQEQILKVEDDDYFNISQLKKTQKPTSKNKDIGLDDLLSKETTNQTKVKNSKKSDDKIEIIKDEEIKIEKKDFELKDIGIELIKEKSLNDNDEKKEEENKELKDIENKRVENKILENNTTLSLDVGKNDENKEDLIKSEIKVEKQDMIFEQKKEQNTEEKEEERRPEEQEQKNKEEIRTKDIKINEIKKEQTEENIKKQQDFNEKPKSNLNLENKDYEIYRDDKIVVYLEKNSISSGEIIIESLSDKNMLDLSEGDLSYMALFSKVFSSILFEESQAHGTNILYDYNSNKVRIIARFQNDGLNLDWNPQKSTQETLDGIKKKLIEVMNDELSNVQDVVKKNVEKVEGEVIGQIENKSDTPQSLEEKAHYILESLKRIP